KRHTEINRNYAIALVVCEVVEGCAFSAFAQFQMRSAASLLAPQKKLEPANQSIWNACHHRSEASYSIAVPCKSREPHATLKAYAAAWNYFINRSRRARTTSDCCYSGTPERRQIDFVQ